jgi:peptide/nickel transport system permease protein
MQSSLNVAAINDTQRKPQPVTLPVRLWRAWWRNSTLAINLSLLLLIGLIGAVLLADVLAPHDPTGMNLRARLKPPVFVSDAALPEFPLGTDAIGRDLLSRILYGGQVSLLVGGVATTLGLLLGTFSGLISGYVGGWLDEIIMYLVDVQLSLPFLLLAVAVALVLGTTLPVLIGLAALATWPIYARVVRGSVLSVRERDYVLAARAAGATDRHIILRHLLPNLLAPVLVLATLSVGRIILLESGLSFLGIGIQPPTPSWGNMISEGREYLSTAWWLSTMPGIALVLLTMAVGTIGDWLRDVMDVRV